MRKRGEVVDVEEAAVVDLVERGSPVRETIGLCLEELVKAVEARRVARDAVHRTDGLRDRRRDGRALAERVERGASGFLLAKAPLGGFRISAVGCRQRVERIEDLAELVRVVTAEALRGAGRRTFGAWRGSIGRS